jgi:hypothetical protein
LDKSTCATLSGPRVAIFHQWKQLEARGCIDNFRIAAGEKVGLHQGWFIADSDAAKWLDAASRIYRHDPTPAGAPRVRNGGRGENADLMFLHRKSGAKTSNQRSFPSPSERGATPLGCPMGRGEGCTPRGTMYGKADFYQHF